MSRLRIVYDRHGDRIAEYHNDVLVWSAPEHDEEKKSGIQIIPDIEPYKAVATDVATGKPPVITSRSRHREFLRRNGYEEVGNEMPRSNLPEPRLKGLKEELAARYYDAKHRRH